jgi:hypothetical protein
MLSVSFSSALHASTAVATTTAKTNRVGGSAGRRGGEGFALQFRMKTEARPILLLEGLSDPATRRRIHEHGEQASKAVLVYPSVTTKSDLSA